MRKLIPAPAPLPSDAATRHSAPHDSAVAHVTGRAIYVDDLPAHARMGYLAVGLSPHAHARLDGLTLDAVRQSPGVIDVITAADIPGRNEVGAVYPGDPLLAERELRYAGQPVFAVVATDLVSARRAVDKAVIHATPLPASLDAVEAIAQGLTVLPVHHHERATPLDRGSAMKNNTQTREAPGEAPAASHCVSGTLSIGGQEHFYLEGQIAQAEALDDDGIRILTSSQHPSEVQKLVAEVLDRPLHSIVAEVRRMGGGFGGKESQAAALGAMAALAAARNHCTVRFRLPRRDDMLMTGKRHPFETHYEVTTDDRGILRDTTISLIGNCGHSPDLSEGVVDRAMFHADNAYYLGNARVTGHRAMTHTASNTAFRGFGGPQGMMPIEAAMDDIARRLGLDPLDVRKRNLYTDQKDETHYGQRLDQHLIGPLIDQLEKQSDYRHRRQAITAFNQENPIIKRGLALTPVKFGISFTAQHLNQAGALLAIYTDGSVLINHGGTEMGQGLHTKVCQIVARVFDIPLGRVRISATRTDKVPNTSPTAASSGADLNGMAARDAALTLRARLLDLAAEQYRQPRDSLTFSDGQLIADGWSMPWEALIQAAYLKRVPLSATGFYSTPTIHYDKTTGKGHPFFYYAYGAAVSEVEIDTLTGEHRLRRVDILHDVGDSLNPAIDRGQIEGGFIQGAGWLTTEELKWDDKGTLLTTGPATYKIPAYSDTPPVFNVALLEGHPCSQATIYRSKAVGEPPFMLALSVWSALRDALSSLTNYTTSPALDVPATPERILLAVEAIKSASTPAACPEGADHG
ncbi:xanthine dehydrogenase molybdopterin binding subunit [Larsenimonas rhizosphaerae]|uniref:xanthine dehydrogenase molybdopterin binding subunit n=1 Tax=Larsenimonas rhizosphaerae TaxID=2944682 RepID=UPI0020332BB8|nr:xanthine dehydrogenase molybdopterin binding subunit [Larsenimonas rhizosphaerae]MCM2130760.1 xanthine dehydrogenase molybdopterin binding subunit [Larsenimonas rhizosphaerae]